MIQYFNIPATAQINTPISKALFADKVNLSAIEKKLLREEIGSITMKALFQTRTIGLDSYLDKDYQYDQMVIAEVTIVNAMKAEAVANMIQRNLPVPMILVISAKDDRCCVNWCVKRINQSDRSKRVIEDVQQTRMVSIDAPDAIALQWLNTLDVTKLKCETIKDLFDRLNEKLIVLKDSDEAGEFISNSTLSIGECRTLFEQLNANRAEQKKVMQELKKEVQFSNLMKLNIKLKELQEVEKNIKDKLK